MEKALSVKALLKRYGSVIALNFVDLDLEVGQRLVILGKNGAGKSTLLRIIRGLEEPDYGQIEMGVSRLSYVPDVIPDFGPMTVSELIGLFSEENGVDAEVLVEEVKFFSVTRFWDRIQHLSKGMRRRLMLAASLGIKPDLPLLDEPFNGLDPGGRRLLSQRLESFDTYIMTTHLIHEIPENATHLAYMINGKIVGIADRETGVWMSSRPVRGESFPFGPSRFIIFGGGGDERIF